MSEDAAKTTKKKPAKPKEQTPHKKLELLVKRVFMTPTARRMKFLILIPTLTNSFFITCSDPEKDHNYGSPSMSLGFVKLKEKEEFDMIKEWFGWFNLSPDDLALVDLTQLSSISAKAKWKRENLVVEVDPSIPLSPLLISVVGSNDVQARPLQKFETLFPAIQIDRQVGIYMDKLVNSDGVFRVSHPVRSKENVFRIRIPYSEFSNEPIGTSFTTDITFLAVRGLDVLDAVDYPDETENLFTGFRFWRPEASKVLRMMHVLDTPDMQLMLTRCNVFLTPVKDNV